jgi:1-aminocyclopropane-1-carboxylate deaminase/D-cysteine desulfhydrase-like pyridoxal-dependent ACC family enzyme
MTRRKQKATIMTKKIENTVANVATVAVASSAYTASIEARIAREVALNTMTLTNRDKLAKAAKHFNQSAVVAFLKKNEVSENFATRSTIQNQMFDVYSIDAMSSIMLYSQKLQSKMKSNCYEIIRTCLQLSKAKLDVTYDDLLVSLDKSLKSKDATRMQYIFKRESQFESAPRQAKLVLHALLALNILKEKSNRVYAVNANSAVAKALDKVMFAATA